jgi:hypothetical protein
VPAAPFGVFALLLAALLLLTFQSLQLYAGLPRCPDDRALRRHIHLIPPHYAHIRRRDSRPSVILIRPLQEPSSKALAANKGPIQVSDAFSSSRRPDGDLFFFFFELFKSVSKRWELGKHHPYVVLLMLEGMVSKMPSPNFVVNILYLRPAFTYSRNTETIP